LKYLELLSFYLYKICVCSASWIFINYTCNLFQFNYIFDARAATTNQPRQKFNWNWKN